MDQPDDPFTLELQVLAGREAQSGSSALIDRLDGCSERVTASIVIAGREPALQKCSTGMSPLTGSDNFVSILITIGDAAGAPFADW
jgi:hypothetical protein